MIVHITVFFVLFIIFADGAVESDRIKSLPGFSGSLPGPQYSGYLNISGGKHLHYYLALDESGSKDSPLVLWFNGGPGCSSMDAVFYEHGPFRVDVSGSSPTLSLNHHRWNLIANIMFIEAPAGVGLSYADTPEGNINNDKQQAVDNFEALLKFYQGFPEFRNRKLVITGESYAGMYVPTLALQVLEYNEKHLDSPIHLDGIMVGNGVIGEAGQNSDRIFVDYLHGHSLYDDLVYQEINKVCGDFSHMSPECRAAINKMQLQIGRVNIYNVLGDCIQDNIRSKSSHDWRAPASHLYQMRGSGSGPYGPVACLDGGAAGTYLNQGSVRQALHVKSVEEIGEWHLCGGPLNYTENWGSLLPNYKNDIIPKTRVLIYNGDADACVPYNGNEEWTRGIGMDVEKEWHPWAVDNQVAGFVTNYAHNFTFVTVKGAGHMVPQYKPVQALAMFERFINHQHL